MLNEQNVLYQKLKTYMKIINFNLEIEQETEKVIKDFSLYPMTEQTLIDLPIDKRALVDSLIYRFLMIIA